MKISILLRNKLHRKYSHHCEWREGHLTRRRSLVQRKSSGTCVTEWVLASLKSGSNSWTRVGTFLRYLQHVRICHGCVCVCGGGGVQRSPYFAPVQHPVWKPSSTHLHSCSLTTTPLSIISRYQGSKPVTVQRQEEVCSSVTALLEGLRAQVALYIQILLNTRLVVSMVLCRIPEKKKIGCKFDIFSQMTSRCPFCWRPYHQHPC